MDLKEEEILGNHIADHWYYRSKLLCMAKFLPRRHYGHLVDVGAGSGFFSKQLLDIGRVDHVTCVDTGYNDDEIRRRSTDPRTVYTRDFNEPTADLMLFMDVLEHVPDDVAVLKHYVDTAPPGCDVFISVPAFKFLWSPHDDFLGHYRRYTTQMLNETVRKSGLEIIRCRYYFGLVFPIAAARRLKAGASKRAPLKSDLKVHSWPVNTALRLACSIERPFAHLNRVAGLSVFCIARKSPA
ncbi:MAG TPA: methyltransferase domain-containing protein [Rhizobiaceae bacterium]|nr:methyltransferase domain-containing protein [Rhizobiaceae bacterium]